MDDAKAKKTALKNAIYVGSVDHRRYVERDHAFNYNIYMLWLSVSEMDMAQGKVAGIPKKSFAPVSVLPSDYMAHRQEKTIGERLAGEIKSKTNESWHGEAFLLAQPRHFGFVINPLALYYCYDATQNLQYIVGEITNTPWGERYCYVFDMRKKSPAKPHKFSFKKEFHVSPFLPMAMDYTWLLSAPGDGLRVDIWNKTGERLDFEAHLELSRRDFSLSGLYGNMLLMPFMTWRIWLGIYINAGVLYALKQVTFYNHPRLKAGADKGVTK